MPDDSKPPEKKSAAADPSSGFGDAGLGMMIPMLMASGPLAGYGLGWLLQRWLGLGRWIIVTMVLLGVVAGMRESYFILRKLSRNQR